MQSGLLWYDNAPAKPLADKVRAAAARYAEKFGKAPDHVYVNAAEQGDVSEVDGITVTGVTNILRSHIWIGCAAE